MERSQSWQEWSLAPAMRSTLRSVIIELLGTHENQIIPENTRHRTLNRNSWESGSVSDCYLILDIKLWKLRNLWKTKTLLWWVVWLYLFWFRIRKWTKIQSIISSKIILGFKDYFFFATPFDANWATFSVFFHMLCASRSMSNIPVHTHAQLLMCSRCICANTMYAGPW